MHEAALEDVLRRRSRETRARIALTTCVLSCALACGGPAQQSAERQAPAPGAAASRPTPELVPDPARLAKAPPELVARLAADAFNYFRFLNSPWAQRVCDAFADELPALPTVRLHGDAHVEQYAFTRAARGLDDFDDSAQGPSVLDLVRFLGSLELAARERGWQASETLLFDRFLNGYRQGLENGHYLPPEPSVVRRLRPTRTREASSFLPWAESLMEPAGDEDLASVRASLARLDNLLRRIQPALPQGYLEMKKAGRLLSGVGSAVALKALARVEGPSPSPDDDVILEGKQLSDLRGVPCLSVPGTGEISRVITGIEQLGRLHHDILAVLPRPPVVTSSTADWWIRSWDPSYVEVTVHDYASVEELAEVAHDAGAQLGAGVLRESGAQVERQKRLSELDALARLEPKIRSVARQLARELTDRWEAFRTSTAPGRTPARTSAQ